MVILSWMPGIQISFSPLGSIILMGAEILCTPAISALCPADVIIAVIGVSRHAAIHTSVLSGLTGVKYVTVHPTPGKADKCSISDVLESQAIIISSPTNTHEFYLRELVRNNYAGYIYLEKPGFHSIDGYRFLLGLSLDIKKRIRIGYHYPYTEKIIRLKDLVNAHSGDDFLSIVLKIGKPLKDFPWFQDDWRNENDFVVSHTLLSHLISVYAFLIGSPAFYPDKISVILNQYPNANATAFAHCHCLNHMFFAVASWDSPFIELDAEIVTRDNIVSLSDALLSARPGRSHYSNGRLIPANLTLHEASKDSGISSCLIDFAASTSKRTSQQDELHRSAEIFFACVLLIKNSASLFCHRYNLN